MKSDFLKRSAAIGAFALILMSVARAGLAEDDTKFGEIAKIKAVVMTYQDALNSADGELAASLYAEDGVLMPPNQPSVVGKAAIHNVYAGGAKALAFNVKFDIAEVVQVAPSWGFVRSNSAGTLTMASTGETHTEANQELFVLHKDKDGQWKIARYSFSSTNPS